MAAQLKPHIKEQTQLFMNEMLKLVQRELNDLLELRKLYSTNKSADSLKEFNNLISAIDRLIAYKDELVQLQLKQAKQEEQLDELNLVEEKILFSIRESARIAQNFKDAYQAKVHLINVLQKQIDIMSALKTSYVDQLSQVRSDIQQTKANIANYRNNTENHLQEGLKEIAHKDETKEIDFKGKKFSYSHADYVTHIQKSMQNKVSDGSITSKNYASKILEASETFFKKILPSESHNTKDFKDITKKEASGLIKSLANSSRAPAIFSGLQQISQAEAHLDALHRKEENIIAAIQDLDANITKAKEAKDLIENNINDPTFTTEQVILKTQEALERIIPTIEAHEENIKMVTEDREAQINKIDFGEDEEFGIDDESANLQKDETIRINPNLSSVAGMQIFFQEHQAPANENPPNYADALNSENVDEPPEYDQPPAYSPSQAQPAAQENKEPEPVSPRRGMNR